MHDRGKPSRAKLDERCKSPFAVQTFEAKTPMTKRSQRRAKVDHTWHGGIHDHADDKSGQPSSGITHLHAQCLEGEESSSEWSWGLPDHA